MTDVTARAEWGRIGQFALRCAMCDWLSRQRDKAREALHRRGLVDAEIHHRWRHHGEAKPS